LGHVDNTFSTEAIPFVFTFTTPSELVKFCLSAGNVGVLIIGSISDVLNSVLILIKLELFTAQESHVALLV
jgi:hypothetical protein